MIMSYDIRTLLDHSDIYFYDIYVSHWVYIYSSVVYWLSSQEMDTAIRVQILDETNCISHSTNTLGKGMNPIILPPAMGK